MPQLWDVTRDFHFVTPIGDAKWVGQSCPRLKIHTFSGTYESVEAALRGSHSRLYSLQQHAWSCPSHTSGSHFVSLLDMMLGIYQIIEDFSILFEISRINLFSIRCHVRINMEILRRPLTSIKKFYNG